jgi:hypothetical protein
MLGRRTPGAPVLRGLGPARRVKFRSIRLPLGTPVASDPRRPRPPLDPAAVRAMTAQVPTEGSVRAGELAVAAAIARFEHHAQMSSAEFAERYLGGEFGHATWARVWFGLLQ